MLWDPLGADLEWFSVQLYLPALTGRVALFSAHVFMLESSSSHAEKADVGAQGQQLDKPEVAGSQGLAWWPG